MASLVRRITHRYRQAAKSTFAKVRGGIAAKTSRREEFFSAVCRWLRLNGQV